MKKTRIFTVCMLGLFGLLMSNRANSQTVPTCESMGYTMTEATCNSKDKAVLKCPLDSSKVFCGLTACDMVTEKTCGSDYTCNGYHPTCSSKCNSCRCTALTPSDWSTYNLLSRPMDGTCGSYGYKQKKWCDTTRYKCCSKLDASQGCLVEMVLDSF